MTAHKENHGTIMIEDDTSDAKSEKVTSSKHGDQDEDEQDNERHDTVGNTSTMGTNGGRRSGARYRVRR